MGNLQNSIPNNQRVRPKVQEETHFEDEINLLDYLKVLWKRRYLILLGSVLPVLIFGLMLFLSPRNYKVTYTYDIEDRIYNVGDIRIGGTEGNVRSAGGEWNLNQKNYSVLLMWFYNSENLNKIAEELHKKGYDDCAERIKTSGLEKFVSFEVSPDFGDLFSANMKDLEWLKQREQLTASLLSITVIGRPKKDVHAVAAVVRDNFENVMPIYLEMEWIKSAIVEHRRKMADIEKNGFNLQLSLKTEKAVLDRMKNLRTTTSDKGESNTTLQIGISGKTEYLPMEYQIQAAESKTIQLEEQIGTDDEKYNYYKHLLGLNEKLLAELKDKIVSYYTIQQFHSFLTDFGDTYDNKELEGYLNSYVKRIENRISAAAPVVEKPKVYVVPKGTAKKSAIVLTVSLVILIFAAFLLEGARKSQAQAS